MADESDELVYSRIFPVWMDCPTCRGVDRFILHTGCEGASLSGPSCIDVKFGFVHRFGEVRYCAVEMAHIGKNY
jgi:hypothetical protein